METENTFLTIGIPTYNRARFLDVCLNSLCIDVGNNPEVEIFVSDNASVDTTEAVVKKYQAKYTNIKYHKQPTNIGVDKNIQTLASNAKGKYIKFQGDDDMFNPGAISSFISSIKQFPDINLFFYHNALNEANKTDTGYDKFFQDLNASNGVSFISSIIIKKDTFTKIEDKDKFIGSGIYQVYLEMEMLKANPDFCLLGGHYLSPRSGMGGRNGYNLGEYLLKNYLTLISSYKQFGFSDDAYRAEKHYLLLNIIFPVALERSRKRNTLSLDGLDDMITEFYSDENYYKEALEYVKTLLQFIKTH